MKKIGCILLFSVQYCSLTGKKGVKIGDNYWLLSEMVD